MATQNNPKGPEGRKKPDNPLEDYMSLWQQAWQGTAGEGSGEGGIEDAFVWTTIPGKQKAAPAEKAPEPSPSQQQPPPQEAGQVSPPEPTRQKRGRQAKPKPAAETAEQQAKQAPAAEEEKAPPVAEERAPAPEQPVLQQPKETPKEPEQPKVQPERSLAQPPPEVPTSKEPEVPQGAQPELSVTSVLEQVFGQTSKREGGVQPVAPAGEPTETPVVEQPVAETTQPKPEPPPRPTVQPAPERPAQGPLTPERLSQLVRQIHDAIRTRGGLTVSVKGELQQRAGAPAVMRFVVQQGWEDVAPFERVMEGVRSVLAQAGVTVRETTPDIELSIEQGRMALRGKHVLESISQGVKIDISFEPIATLAPPPVTAQAPAGQAPQQQATVLTAEEQVALNLARMAAQLYGQFTGPKVPPALYRAPGSTKEFYTPYLLPPHMVAGFLKILEEQVPAGVHDIVYAEPVSVRPSGKPVAPGEPEEGTLPGMRYVFGRTSQLTGETEVVSSFVAPVGQPKTRGILPTLGIALTGFITGLLGLKPGTIGLFGVSRMHPGAKKELQGEKPVQKAYGDKPIETMAQLLSEAMSVARSKDLEGITEAVTRVIHQFELGPIPGNPGAWGKTARTRWMQAAGATRLAVPLAYAMKAYEQKTGQSVQLDIPTAIQAATSTYGAIAEKYGIDTEKISSLVEQGIHSLPDYGWLFEQEGAFGGGARPSAGDVSTLTGMVGALLGPVWKDAEGKVFVSETPLHPLVAVETFPTQPSDLTASIMMALTSASTNVTSNRAQAAVLTNMLAKLHSYGGGVVHRAYSSLPFKAATGEWMEHRLVLQSPGPSKSEFTPADAENLQTYLEGGRSLLTKAAALSGIRITSKIAKDIEEGVDKHPLFKALRDAILEESKRATVAEGVAELWTREWGNLPDKVGLLLSGASSGFVSFKSDVKSAIGGGLLWPILYGRMWGVTNLPAVATRIAIGAYGEIGSGARAQYWLTRGLVADAAIQVVQKVDESKIQELARTLFEDEPMDITKSDLLYYTSLLATHPEVTNSAPAYEGWKNIIKLVNAVFAQGLQQYGVTQLSESPFADTIEQWRKDITGISSMWFKEASEKATEYEGGQLLQLMVGQSALDIVVRSFEEVEKALPATAHTASYRAGQEQKRQWWWEYSPTEVRQMVDYVKSSAPLIDWPERVASILKPFDEPTTRREAVLKLFGSSDAQLDEELIAISEQTYRMLATPATQAVLGVSMGERAAKGIGTHFLWRALPFGRAYKAETDIGPLKLQAGVAYPPTHEDPTAYGVGFKVFEYLKTMLTPPTQKVFIGQGFPIDAHMHFSLFNKLGSARDTQVSVSFEYLPASLDLRIESTGGVRVAGGLEQAEQEYAVAEAQRRRDVEAKLTAYEVAAGLRSLQAGLPLVRVPDALAEAVGWSKEERVAFYEKAAEVASLLAVWESVAGQGVLGPEKEQQLVQDIARGFAQLQLPHAINQAFHHQHFMLTQAKRAEGGDYEQLKQAVSVQEPPVTPQRVGSAYAIPFLSTFKMDK